MGEPRFARLPAKIDRPPVPDRGEVQQLQMDAFHDAAVGLDPVDQVDDLRLEVGEAPGRTPCSGKSCLDRRVAFEQPNRQLTTLLPQLVDERFNDEECELERSPNHRQTTTQSLGSRGFVLVQDILSEV